MVRILMILAVVTMVGCGRQGKPVAQQQPATGVDARLNGEWTGTGKSEAATVNASVTNFESTEVVTFAPGKVTQVVNCKANLIGKKATVVPAGVGVFSVPVPVELPTKTPKHATTQTSGAVKIVAPGKLEVSGVTPASEVLHRNPGFGAFHNPVFCETTLKNGVYEYTVDASGNAIVVKAAGAAAGTTFKRSK